MKNKKEKPKYRIYKETWKRILSELVPIVKSWGFEDIKYEGWNGWSPENQMYSHTMLHSDLSAGILEFDVTLFPRHNILNITISRYSNHMEHESFDDYNYSASEWSEHQYYKGSIKYELQQHPFYLIFNPKFLLFKPSEFKIKYNKKTPEKNNLDILFMQIHKNIPFLKEVVFGSYNGNLIEVTEDPPRPKLTVEEMNQNYENWKKAKKEKELRKQKYFYYGLGIFIFIIVGLIIYDLIIG